MKLHSVSGTILSVNRAPAAFTHFRCTPSVEECTPSMQHLRYSHTFVALRRGKNALRQWNTCGIYILLLHSVKGRIRSVSGTPAAFTNFRQWSNALRQCSTCGIYTLSLHSVSERLHSVNATPPVFTCFRCTPSGEECTLSMQHLRYLHTFVALR